jgi:hypothetical protein
MKTQGTADVCPDLRIDLLNYVESKSVGLTRCSIIYAARMRKDLRFTREHKVTMWYCLWHHTCSIKGIDSTLALNKQLALRTQYAILLPLRTVYRQTRGLGLKVLNKSYFIRHGVHQGTRLGYGNRSKGYGVGWSVSLKKLCKVCPVQLTHPSINVLGCEIPAFPVYTTLNGTEKLVEIPVAPIICPQTGLPVG